MTTNSSCILPIITYPDPRLETPSSFINVIDDTVRQNALNMIKTMHHSQGIGLAGVQVGIMQHILVIDITKENAEYANMKQENTSTQATKNISSYTNGPLVVINPKIIKTSKETIHYQEGCLSFPNQTIKVKRFVDVTVEYQNLNGEPQTIDAGGLLAICLQHEIDHINGIVFIKHLSYLRRQILTKKLQKQLKSD